MPLYPAQALDFFNVKDFGAVGDGAHDDTSAIQAAINAAAGGIVDDTNTRGGGVLLPAGVYVTSTLLIHSFVHLTGAGIQATTLLLKAGTNADLIDGYQALSLINIGAAGNTGSLGGTANWGLHDLTLDGNKTNQTGGTSWCIRDYGLGFIIENVRIRNGQNGGWQQDWNGSSQSPGLDSMEANLVNVKIHDCGGMGLEWGGPHDSQIANFESFHNDSHGVHLGPNASGMLFVNSHSWGVTVHKGAVCWLVESPGCLWSNGIGEGSDVCNIVALAPGLIWEGFTYGPPYPSLGFQLGQVASAVLKTAATTSPITLTTGPTNQGASGAFLQFVITGASVGGTIAVTGTDVTGTSVSDNLAPSGNGTYQTTNAYIAVTSITVTGLTGYSITVNGLTSPYAGQIQQSGGVALANPANGAMIFAKSNECRNGAIDFVNESASTVRMQIYQTAGTAVIGTPSTSTLSEIVVNGITADGTLALSGGSTFPIKGNNAFRVSSITQDIFNINASAGFVQIPNNTVVRMYSDNYSTRTVELNGGTVAVLQSTTAPALSTGGTITTSGVGIARVAPTGNVTGVILQAGVRAGQQVIVRNESAFTVTFNTTPATSNVADAAAALAIPALTSRAFEWNSIGALWSRCSG
jgi:hypothetical protein